MNQPETTKSFMSFCAAAGAEAARRWLLCPSASMADYRDSVLAELLAACDEPQHAAGRTRDFCDGFAARIAQEIASRSTDVHHRARRALQTSGRPTRLRSHLPRHHARQVARIVTLKASSATDRAIAGRARAQNLSRI